MISNTLKLLPLLIAFAFGEIGNFSDVMDTANSGLEFGKTSCSKYFDKYCPVKDPWNPHCAYRKNKLEGQYGVLNISPRLYKHCTTCGIRQIYETNRYAYKIYGGRESVPHSWPWMAGLYELTTEDWYAHVTLQKYTRTGMICAASLISEKYAITAAHCLIEPEKQVMEKKWYLVKETLQRSLFLRFGDHHRSNWWFEPQVDVPILGFTIYKSDSDKFSGDVAILELERPVSFTPQIHPVCLPPPNLYLKAATKCIAVGWGLLNDYPPIPALTLHEAEMSIVSPILCHTVNRKIQLDMLVCAYELEKVNLKLKSL
ncbi:unnamed protein product [Hymenolepis diminuta]|uniref:Peptidase S1 domain-containing protein n=1 Tax=Hymenolepis diminuta TaxID=6216 RepID=A0A0R3SVE0_HYMDI|nr:unnamed protein product [Hymenolepis diminuta]